MPFKENSKEKKNHPVLIKFSIKQLREIDRKAEMVGLSRTEFIRFCCLKITLREVKGLL